MTMIGDAIFLIMLMMLLVLVIAVALIAGDLHIIACALDRIAKVAERSDDGDEP